MEEGRAGVRDTMRHPSRARVCVRRRYYIESAPAPAPTSGPNASYVIFLEGGGACWSNEGPFSCWNRYFSPYGSSKHWQPTQPYDGNLMNRNCAVSPLCDATLVYVPYCSGDVHSGQRAAPLSSQLPFYFSGHNNLVAIVSSLMNTTGIATAGNVLLSGASAGGYGTYINVEWLASVLPKTTRVRAFPQGGWFVPDVVMWQVCAGSMGGDGLAGLPCERRASGCAASRGHRASAWRQCGAARVPASLSLLLCPRVPPCRRGWRATMARRTRGPTAP
jgi:hypothetical protein